MRAVSKLGDALLAGEVSVPGSQDGSRNCRKSQNDQSGSYGSEDTEATIEYEHIGTSQASSERAKKLEILSYSAKGRSES